MEQQPKTFVNDKFFVEGTISCKFISHLYSDEYSKKVGSHKLKFDLTNDESNNSIIQQLKNKEMYFFKRTIDTLKNNGTLVYPLNVKSFLGSDGDVVITETKTTPDFVIVNKNIGGKIESSDTISNSANSVSLKVKFDINEKNIKPLKSNAQTKLSFVDLIELVKSENLKLKVKISCSAVFINNTLFISGTLMKISIEQSKMVEVFNELKEKNNNDSKKNMRSALKDKIYIQQFPTKASTITNNIVDILTNNSQTP